jgi:phenylpropionate dioxygenase-like ring-hydroxylating dioxygenase large terminal subunit
VRQFIDVLSLPRVIRVFHNIGAHEGCPIALTRQSQATTLEGPYHGWQYNLRGVLVKAPFWDGTSNPDLSGLRKESADLKEVRSSIWNDILFVDLWGTCPALPMFLAPLMALFEDFDFSTLEMAGRAGDNIVYFEYLSERYVPGVSDPRPNQHPGARGRRQ